MRVLVTGGAGFIGSNLVEYHLANHDEVFVIDDLSTGVMANVSQFTNHPNYHFIQDDLLTLPNLDEIVCSVDRIYHMAAVVGVLKVINDSARLLDTNILATDRLLSAAKHSTRNPRILLASSSEVYGDGHARPLKETANLIIGEGRKNCAAYVASKIALEFFGLSYYKHCGLATTSLRLFNTIGPRQLGGYGMVVPRFVKNALAGEPITVFGTGEQTRSFCDVRDTVSLMDKIASNPKTIGEIINVGHDQEISINDLAMLVKKIQATKSEIVHIPYSKVYGDNFEDIMFRRPDLTKLQEMTNYTYKWDLNKTLADLSGY